MKLTEHFSLEEMVASSTASIRGIDNYPLQPEIENLKLLCEEVLEPARIALGMPLTITSGYRSPELNRAVNGAKTSHHVRGMAADVVCSNNKKLLQWIEMHCKFTQLISEKGTIQNPAWVHVSYDKNNLKNQVLRIN
jgi:Peptidase M15